MKLYREAGMNPLGCIVPRHQFPSLDRVYQSIVKSRVVTRASSTCQVAVLLVVRRPYLLTISLAKLSIPDRSILPVLVGISM